MRKARFDFQSRLPKAAMVAASKHMISSTDQLVRLADMYLAITMGLSDGQRAAGNRMCSDTLRTKHIT